ncbi:type VII secretion protein EccE [Streptomyces sp. MP131-18]|uniref:type VII secretion protein EccE n=1 Tax=Streptomyces sp. MP131-18 TaxID=1857892 RepID=UPI0009A15065|nr:type VII secretion protein EccE [Streptomyces sp. MP131-18]ONK12464.1 type VII secretion protein EccE [Streptomyces sp. MP131-18]
MSTGPKAPGARFGRGRLVAVQSALGCLAAGIAYHDSGPWAWALGALGVLLAAAALLRSRGGWADQRLLERVRRRALTGAPVAGPAAGAADHLGVVHTLLPALDVTEVADRNGYALGVLADGRGYAAVLAFPGGALPAVPAGPVAQWLAEDPACPAAAQLVVEQFGLPPWDFHYRYQPTICYRQLPTGGRPVALRSWLVVRHEPIDAPEAAERRGGGAAGARAAVAAATARIRARLAAFGVATTPLDADALRDLLRQIGDASGDGRALAGSWAGSAATHCTVTARVGGQGDWARLLAGLAGCTADRVVAAATLTAEGGELRIRTAVRIVSTLAQHAASERDRLVRAGAVGPPAEDQAAGLLATLPVAHPSRPLVEAAGFSGTAAAAGGPTPTTAGGAR